VVLSASMVAVLSSSGPTPPLDPHDPILIESDSDFTEANGVVGGAGTSMSPYLISDWEIDGTSGTGISISGTTKYFIISNVIVHSSPSGMTNGISLSSVSHGQIEDVQVNNTGYGIRISSSNDVSIMDTNISACNWGVYATTWSGGTIQSCVISEMSKTGVYLSGSDSVTMQSNDIWECTGSDLESSAICLYDSTGCEILGNKLNNSVRGIVFYWSSNTNVSGNTITEIDWSGVYCYDTCQDITLFSNEISSCSIDSAVNVDLFGGSAVDFVISYNTIRDNIGTFTGGIYLSYTSTGNLIHHNDFLSNSPSHALDDGPAANLWNDTTEGNYWDDYTPPGPYDVDFDTQDLHPLLSPVGANTKPVASFTVTPDSGETGDTFSVDASGCSDAEDAVGLLQVRWDWDGDGDWDTSWSTSKTAQHIYPAAGNYSIRLEVMDTGGLRNITSRDVEVTGGVIPEFSTVVLPVVAMLAIFLFVRRRK
jgi:parallel beta-helix repeat protein